GGPVPAVGRRRLPVYLDNSHSTLVATRHTRTARVAEVTFASENDGHRHGAFIPGPGATAREIEQKAHSQELKPRKLGTRHRSVAKIGGVPSGCYETAQPTGATSPPLDAIPP